MLFFCYLSTQPFDIQFINPLLRGNYLEILPLNIVDILITYKNFI
jgi:hypothetical protein